MNIITSREAVDFLSKSAPRPWVKRMLLWMIVAGELTPWFESAKSTEVTSGVALMVGIGTRNLETEDALRLITERYGEDVSKAAAGKKRIDKIAREVHRWPETRNVHPVTPGYFIHAREIDWEKGFVRSEIADVYKNARMLFSEEDELLQGKFERATFQVELQHLHFERARVEMMQPNVELSNETAQVSVGSAPIGRPRTWDWEGATTYLITIAQTPDGLPTGAGAQAKIERMLADWFAQEFGREPSESQIRRHVSKIAAAIERSKGPKSL